MSTDRKDVTITFEATEAQPSTPKLRVSITQGDMSMADTVTQEQGLAALLTGVLGAKAAEVKASQ